MKYANALISLALAVAVPLGVALSDGRLSQAEDVGLVIAFLQPFAVYIAPGLPDGALWKPLAAWGLTAAQALAAILPAGGIQAVSISQWVMIATAAFAAIGITAYQTSQAKSPAPVTP